MIPTSPTWLTAFPEFDSWLIAATFSRHGGVSKAPFTSLNTAKAVRDDVAAVLENRRRILESLGIPGVQLLTPSLNHTKIVECVDPRSLQLPEYPHDGVILTVSNVAVLMSTADCNPIFIADPQTHQVALIHAGWRGVDQNIIGETVAKMVSLGSDRDSLCVWVGPSIGPCCYVLSEATQASDPTWAPFISKTKDELFRIDLWNAARSQLRAAGIQENKIKGAWICTACNTDKYFSYAKERPQTGRFASIICLR